MPEQFKPLWRIHNATYRKYAKGYRRKQLAKFADRLKKVLKLHSAAKK